MSMHFFKVHKNMNTTKIQCSYFFFLAKDSNNLNKSLMILYFYFHAKCYIFDYPFSKVIKIIFILKHPKSCSLSNILE